MIQSNFYSLLTTVFNALSSLYGGNFNSRERKYGS